MRRQGRHGVAPPPAGSPYRRALAVPAFRRVYAAHALSVTGDQVARVALAILVFRHTGSPALTAGTYAVTYLPWLVGGPLLSTLADRYPRRTIMIACDVGRALLVAAMVVPGLPLGALFALVWAVTCLDPPFYAARSALLPDLLGEERYGAGLSLQQMTLHVAQAAGFAAGGSLVAFAGVRGALLADAGSFVASAAFLVGVPATRPGPGAAARARRLRLFADARSGARLVFGDPTRRYITLLVWCGAALSILPPGLAVIYAQRHGAGAAAAGLLTAAAPAGMAIGAVLIARLAPATRRRLMLPLAMAQAAVLGVTIADPAPALVALAWIGSGAGAAFAITANEIFVMATPPESRGAAFGVTGAGIYALEGVAIAVAGFAADHVALPVVLGGAGAAGLVLMAVVAAFRPRPEPVAESPQEDIRVGRGREGNGERNAVRTMSPRGAASGAMRRIDPAMMRVWGLTLGVAAATCAVLVTRYGGTGPYLSTPHLPYAAWVVTGVYACTLALPATFELRHDAYAVALAQLPLMAALYFLTPDAQVLAVGGAAAIVYLAERRLPFYKVAFNVANYSFGALCAVAVFHALAPAAPTWQAAGWPAAVVASLADEAVTTLLVVIVIGLAAGTWRLPHSLPFNAVSNLVATGMGLVAVTATAADPPTAFLLVAISLLIAAAARGYRANADRRAVLQRLYSFSRRLGPLADSLDDLSPALQEARELLHAEELELALVGGEAPLTRISVTDASVTTDVHLEDDADDGLPSQDGPGTVPTRRRLLAAGLARDEGHDHLVAQVRTSGATVGSLSVRDRSGNVRRFDAADLEVLESLAGQIGTALEKGRLVESLRRAATRDSLTGLANLDAVRAHLTGLLQPGPLAASGAVVLFADLDRFSDVNETLGHEAGDRLLIDVAGRLAQAAPEEAVAARISGDKFVLVLRGAASGEIARLAAMAVKSRLDGPVRLLELSADIRVTVGIARAPDHGTDASVLLRRAEAAMTAAKGTAGGISEWEPALDGAGPRRLAMVSALRRTLAEGGLQVHYQPKIELGTGRVTGLEALARWYHPDFGQVRPDEFVPLAETCGLVGALTTNVLRQALRDCRSWHDDGRPVSVAVNLSARSLSDPALVGQVAALLTAHGLPPNCLTLEITESSVMDNPAHSIEVMHQLRGLGVTLSIDDFGTGYSSLTYVKGFPVHELKVDKSFIDSITTDDADRAVVRAVVELSRSLGLVTVAEGVEEPDQALVLEQLGLDQVQGYFYARPMPAADAAAWLRTRPVAQQPR